MPIKLLNNIVLTDFIELALGPVANFVSVPPVIAEQIQQVDRDEQYCHIEWIEGGKPRLWRIDDWRTSYKRQMQKQQESMLSRAVAVRATELKAALAIRIREATGLSFEESETLIATIIKTRNSKAATTFNVNLDELIEADNALKQFKGMK